jgi:hypothetical protein
VIQADINTNERLGQFPACLAPPLLTLLPPTAGVLNSRLINAYCNLHPLVRPLCVFLKFWAKQRGLNDPSGHQGPVTFSSYTLILLVIAYLQTIDVLPNLQDPKLIAEANVPRTRFYSTPKVRKAKHVR